MNTDIGRIHRATVVVDKAALARAERIAKGGSPRETAEDVLARATKKLEGEVARSTVVPGAELPPDWPRFEIGDEVGPIKGWFFELVDVDLEAQELLIKPKRKAGKKRPPKKKRRRRR